MSIKWYFRITISKYRFGVWANGPSTNPCQHQPFQEVPKADPKRTTSPPGILKRRLFPEDAAEQVQEAAEKGEEEVPTHDEEVDVSAEEEIPATQADVEVSGEDVESPGANDKGTFQAR